MYVASTGTPSVCSAGPMITAAMMNDAVTGTARPSSSTVSAASTAVIARFSPDAPTMIDDALSPSPVSVTTATMIPAAAVVAAALPAPQPGQTTPGQPQGQQPSMVGLAIHSADGMMLGHVTGLKRRADGSLEAIEAEIGTPLGLGASSVLISPGDLRWKGDGVELQMAAEQVRTILRSQRR